MSILYITTELVTPLQNNLTALIYSLVNGLYKITTESKKLVLDVEQFDVSSDYIIPTHNAQKVSFSFFLLRIFVKTFHGFHRNAIKNFQPRIHHEV